MLSILAPARTALWIAIGCQRASHLASADMVASSASSSYAVRSVMGCRLVGYEPPWPAWAAIRGYSAWIQPTRSSRLTVSSKAG